MENFELIDQYLNKIRDGIDADAQSKNQKIPVSSFRIEVSMTEGSLFAADYMKYLIYGRPPGKQPPPNRMLDWVKENPDIFASLKAVFENLTERGLAYIVGRKIGREGSAIFRGDRPGVDLLGVMEKETPAFLAQLEKNEALNIATALRSAAIR